MKFDLAMVVGCIVGVILVLGVVVPVVDATTTHTVTYDNSSSSAIDARTFTGGETFTLTMYGDETEYTVTTGGETYTYSEGFIVVAEGGGYVTFRPVNNAIPIITYSSYGGSGCDLMATHDHVLTITYDGSKVKVSIVGSVYGKTYTSVDKAIIIGMSDGADSVAYKGLIEQKYYADDYAMLSTYGNGFLTDNDEVTIGTVTVEETEHETSADGVKTFPANTQPLEVTV